MLLLPPPDSKVPALGQRAPLKDHIGESSQFGVGDQSGQECLMGSAEVSKQRYDALTLGVFTWRWLRRFPPYLYGS